MITSKSFHNKQFKSRDELIYEVIKSKDLLIASKLSQVKTHGYCVLDFNRVFTKSESSKNNVKNIVNTMYYFDSHEDVHFPGNWNKSIKEQAGKVFHAIDHEIKVGNIAAYPEDVKMWTESITWKELGINKEGKTEIFIAETPKDRLRNQNAIDIYLNHTKYARHSPRLIYRKVEIAIDTTDPNLSEAKELYDSTIDLIANSEEVKQNGFFYAIKEAQIYKEYSLVLNPSNIITQTMEAVEDTSGKSEPPKGTQYQKIINPNLY